MDRDLNLTTTQTPIRGKFRFPQSEGRELQGTLYLEAGKDPRLEIEDFDEAPSNQGFLTSFHNNQPKARKLIHGYDEHGTEITLVNCYPSRSKRTLAVVSTTYQCDEAIIGKCFDFSKDRIAGIRLDFDHLQTWAQLSAYRRIDPSNLPGMEDKAQRLIAFQTSSSPVHPLKLPGYLDSSFFCQFSQVHGSSEDRLSSHTFFDLHFEQPKTWIETLTEGHHWKWFFSLATRTDVDFVSIGVYTDEEHYQTRPPYPVWRQRMSTKTIAHPNRHAGDFHFSGTDIAGSFPAVAGRWQTMLKDWAAVIHNFDAATASRSLRIHEEFLFLTHAIEAMDAARNSKKSRFNKAAKDAYLMSPPELRTLLGSKKKFMNQLQKSRNYWTHYGDPSPETNPGEVLTGRELSDLAEKLRMIIAAALLSELGLPNHCVERVWSSQWIRRWVDYE